MIVHARVGGKTTFWQNRHDRFCKIVHGTVNLPPHHTGIQGALVPWQHGYTKMAARLKRRILLCLHTPGVMGDFPLCQASGFATINRRCHSSRQPSHGTWTDAGGAGAAPHTVAAHAHARYSVDPSFYLRTLRALRCNALVAPPRCHLPTRTCMPSRSFLVLRLPVTSLTWDIRARLGSPCGTSSLHWWAGHWISCATASVVEPSLLHTLHHTTAARGACALPLRLNAPV